MICAEFELKLGKIKGTGRSGERHQTPEIALLAACPKLRLQFGLCLKLKARYMLKP